MAVTQPLSEELRAREALAQMIWTVGIVGFFGVQAIVWAVAITLTHNDPSHAVVADLDERVDSWERRRKAQSASQQLGWQAEISVAPQADSLGQRMIEVRVLDAQGQPVELDELQLSLFHRARVAERRELDFQPLAAGHWQASALMRRSGRWRFSGQAIRDQQRLLIQEDQFLTF